MRQSYAFKHYFSNFIDNNHNLNSLLKHRLLGLNLDSLNLTLLGGGLIICIYNEQHPWYLLSSKKKTKKRKKGSILVSQAFQTLRDGVTKRTTCREVKPLSELTIPELNGLVGLTFLKWTPGLSERMANQEFSAHLLCWQERNQK